ncbi:MAG: GNAT family N-acetyltransferase [Pseudomonadota bacterium]
MIRPARPADVQVLGEIAEACGLFPATLIDDMIAPAFAGAPDLWRVVEHAGAAVGFAFARPEPMTDAVWNLLALGVLPAAQSAGLAKALIAQIEAAANARMIIIETTQLPDQAAARALYAKAGYEEEGRVRDFYGDGEDKVIFRKLFAGGGSA